MTKGVTVWFTGLSGSGKTTIAKRPPAELTRPEVARILMEAYRSQAS